MSANIDGSGQRNNTLPVHVPSAQSSYDMVAYPDQDQPSAGQFDLRELWLNIRRYKNTVAAILCIVVAVTLIGTLLTRPVYRATTIIEVTPNSRSAVKFQNIENSHVPTKEYLRNQISVLTSKVLAKTVIEDLDLQNDPEISGEINQRGLMVGISKLVSVVMAKVRPVVEEPSSVGAEVEDGPEVAMINRFLSKLSARSIRNSTQFQVSFDSFDPKRSAAITNAVAEAYMSINDDRRFSSSSSAKRFLNKEIQKVQAKLESSERELTDFARANDIVDVEDKSNILNTSLQDLSNKLTNVKSDRIAAEAEYLEASESAAAASPAVLKSTLVGSLKGTRAELLGEYMRLSGIYKEDYPALAQLRQKIDQIDQEIAAEGSKIVGGLRARMNELKEQEVRLSEALEAQKGSMLDLQERSVQYNILKREWETNKELYGGLLERMKEVGVAAGVALNNAVIIDKAVIPNRKFSPSILANLLLATTVGLMLGLGIALLLGYLDNTFNTSEELERVLNLSSLGMVPIIHQEDLPDQPSIDLICHQAREDEASEAFRSVRTSLMFSSPLGAPPVLLVTSSAPSEGKSMSSANLALVLAQNDAKVLLVDCDMRRPRMHKAFSIPSSPGLSELLTSNESQSVIRRTELDNLHLLTAGTLPPNPAELLGSERMDEVLSSLKEHYDHIVLDAPPVLGVADSVILSIKADGVVLVVSANQVSKDAAREAVKRLRMVKAPLIGALFNKVDTRLGIAGYDGYYYGYGEDSAQARG